MRDFSNIPRWSLQHENHEEQRPWVDRLIRAASQKFAAGASEEDVAGSLRTAGASEEETFMATKAGKILFEREFDDNEPTMPDMRR